MRKRHKLLKRGPDEERWTAPDGDVIVENGVADAIRADERAKMLSPDIIDLVRRTLSTGAYQMAKGELPYAAKAQEVCAMLHAALTEPVKPSPLLPGPVLLGEPEAQP